MKTDIYDFYIRPNAARTKIDGLYGDRIKIRVAAAPEKGKANRELIRLISEITGVAQKKIRIISGAASNYKKIQVEGDRSIDYSEVLLNSSQIIR
jgi:uncharacterized protein